MIKTVPMDIVVRTVVRKRKRGAKTQNNQLSNFNYYKPCLLGAAGFASYFDKLRMTRRATFPGGGFYFKFTYL